MYKKSLETIQSTFTTLGGLSILLTTMTLGLNSPILNNPASAMPVEPIEKPKPDPNPKPTQENPRTRTPVFRNNSAIGTGTIQGNISSTESRAQSVPCNRITITFTELIPPKRNTDPEPGTSPRFGTPTIKEISKAPATGETLASGCKYAISGGNLKLVSTRTPDGDISFTISAFSPTNGGVTGAGFGASAYLKEIPSSLDFSMVYRPGVK
jgi:hypothetical protein